MRAQNEMMEFKIRALANLFQGVNDHYLTGAKTLSHELERLKTLLLPLQKTLEAVKVIDEFDMPLPLDQFLPLDEILGDRVALRKGKGKTGETDEHLRQVAFPNQTRAPKSWLSEYLKNQQVLVREEGLDRNIENERQIDKTISINEKMLSGMTTEKEEKMTEKGADRQEAIHQLKVLLQKIPIGGEISTSEGILSKVITERGNSVEEIMQKLPELIDEKMLSGMATEKEEQIMEKGADRQEAISRLKEIIADARHKRSSVGEELLDKMVQKVSVAVEEV